MFGAARRCAASLSLRTSLRVGIASARSVAPQSATQAAWRNTVSRNSIAYFHNSTKRAEIGAATATAPADDADVNDASELITKFKELETQGLVHGNVIRTITDFMGLETMTDVQSKTINEALKGSDMIARAKTGTGKTLAFLLPILQRVLEDDPTLAVKTNTRSGQRQVRTSPNDIRAIIVSPTRELAEQIAVEAEKILSNTNIVVQRAVGGTQKSAALRDMQRRGCHLLVATPGRLNDILEDPYSRVEAPKLQALVYDEADRLLEAGFDKELQAIMKKLPDPRQTNRQTLMFSATVPEQVVGLVRRTLKPGFQFVNCVPKDEVPTHARVPQKKVKVPGLENMLPALLELCQRELQESERQIQAGEKALPFKAIVYFNTTAEVELATNVFMNLSDDVRSHPLRPARIYDIHGRLTQGQRTKASDMFRNSRSAILLSSDVTSRGLDFPNVTHVIQMGIPRDREDYVHRIGRTGRAGKEGQGWLIVPDLLAPTADRQLRGFPLKDDTSLVTSSVDMKQEARIPEDAAKILNSVLRAFSGVDDDLKYKSFVGHLGALKPLASTPAILPALTNLAKFGWGMEEPPHVSPAVLAKAGLGGNSRSGGHSDRGGYGGRSDYSSSRGGPPRGGGGMRGGMRGGGSRGPPRDSRGGGYGGGSSYGGGSGYGRDGSRSSRGGDRRGGDRGRSFNSRY